MVRRASDLTGRKDRRDYHSSRGNFRGSGACPASPTIQALSCGVLPNMLQDQRAARLSSGRLFLGSKFPGLRHLMES